MSPSTPNDFIGSLVEMAEAYRELPKVQAERNELLEQLNQYSATIQRLELKLLERSNEIALLHSRIRELEVSRDEAQFHALEADDRTARALDFIKATFGNAGTLIQALEPPREASNQPVDTTSAVSEAKAEPWPSTADEGTGESAVDPTSATTHGSNTSEGSVAPIDASIVASTLTDPAPSPAPEVAASPGEPDVQSTEALSVGSATPVDAVKLSADASEPPAPNPSDYNRTGPYAGKRYSEVVASGHWPTRDQWEAGGGTVDNWFA